MGSQKSEEYGKRRYVREANNNNNSHKNNTDDVYFHQKREW